MRHGSKESLSALSYPWSDADDRVMTTVEVFADIVCPFTHVGLRRLTEARNARGAETLLRVRAWPLEWVNGRPVDPALAAEEIEALRTQVAPGMFAGFDTSLFPRTSIPAFGLAAAGYALDDETGEAVSLAVRDALFEEGLDITDLEVLRAVGRPFGVEPLDLETAMRAVRTDWERGQARRRARFAALLPRRPLLVLPEPRHSPRTGPVRHRRRRGQHARVLRGGARLTSRRIGRGSTHANDGITYIRSGMAENPTWDSDVVLADGGTVHLRLIAPTDERALVDLYEALSDESVYLRFFSPVPRPTAAELERITDVDRRDHVVLVAELGDRLVAVARDDRIAPDEAEVAFTVRDDEQRRGIATLLLEHLAVVARRTESVSSRRTRCRTTPAC